MARRHFHGRRTFIPETWHFLHIWLPCRVNHLPGLLQHPAEGRRQGTGSRNRAWESWQVPEWGVGAAAAPSAAPADHRSPHSTCPSFQIQLGSFLGGESELSRVLSYRSLCCSGSTRVLVRLGPCAPALLTRLPWHARLPWHPRRFGGRVSFLSPSRSPPLFKNVLYHGNLWSLKLCLAHFPTQRGNSRRTGWAGA